MWAFDPSCCNVQDVMIVNFGINFAFMLQRVEASQTITEAGFMVWQTLFNSGEIAEAILPITRSLLVKLKLDKLKLDKLNRHP